MGNDAVRRSGALIALPAAVGERRAAVQTRADPLWRDSLLWFTLALTLFALAPFALPGYFWGANDARHHVYFLFEYDRLVADGIWWPRWSPDFAFGYGYPFFNIYGPLSHFLAEVLHHFLGFGLTDAIEAVFCLSIVGSAAAMFAYVRSWLGSAAATVAALVYAYAPYHLLNLYVRANLAESMAFVWLPLCLWTARGAVRQPSWRWIVGLAVSYAGLMLTSNLVIVLFTGPLGLYILLLILLYDDAGTAGQTRPTLWRRLGCWLRTGLAPAAGIAAGLGLSAVFWLPAVLEQKYVRVDQWFAGRYDYRDNFVYFFNSLAHTGVFGASQPGPDDPFGFQIGAVPLAFAVLGLLLATQITRRQRWELRFFTLVGVVATLICLQIARPLWDLPILGTVLGFAQFPWRWLSITTLCISIIAGLVAYPGGSGQPQLNLPLVVFIGLILLGSYPYLQVEIRPPAEGPIGLAALMRFQQSSDEMTGSTAWVKEIPTWSPMADYYISQEAAGEEVKPISTLVDYSNKTWPIDYETFGVASVAHNSVMEEVYFGNRSTKEQRIVFNQFYYPGWKAYLLDGEHGKLLRELPIIPEENGALGRMTVPVPQGEGYILLRYGDTLPRAIGRLISIATLVGLTLAGVLVRRFSAPEPAINIPST